jgi:hypothetical protein
VAYPTAEELIAESTVDELVQLTADQQEGIRAAAIVAIEDHCSQSFTSEVETRTIDGTRKRKLYLPRRLESLTSVSAPGGSALSGIVLSDDHDFIELPPAAGMGYYEQTLRKVSGEAYYGLDGKLTITGTWGWTDCPEAVKTALRFDMEEQALADTNELGSTIAAYRKLGVRSISQGNLRVTVGDEVLLSPRVIRQLARFVWTTPGELV